MLSAVDLGMDLELANLFLQPAGLRYGRAFRPRFLTSHSFAPKKQVGELAESVARCCCGPLSMLEKLGEVPERRCPASINNAVTGSSILP